jgi:cytochrome c-type biogenesis protein CcmH/NrfG
MLQYLSQWLQQPATSGWLLLVCAVALVVLALCAVFGAFVLVHVLRHVQQRASFAEQAQPLLDQSDLEALIALCRQRLATYHDDASAHYFMGCALHRSGELRLALTYLKRIPELQPGWDVSAMIAAIEAKVLAAGEERPELRVVPSPQDTPAQSDRKDA